MNTSVFLKVLQHFSGSTREEAETVLSLKEYFPFSQVLRVMSARVSKDHGFNNQQSELQLAAVYAADRSVLKQIMAADFMPFVEDKSTTPIHSKAEDKNLRSDIVHSHTVETTDVTEELFNDLERLNQLKQNFEMMFIDVSTTSIQTSKPVEADEDNVAVQESTKSKKQRIIELARSVNSVSEPLKEEPVEPRLKRRKKQESGDVIINEIATKEELTPESEKQKEQIEIIDHFIRKQPSISGAKDKQPDQMDLATIKTGEFSDNIVSETLAEILIRQGKKDKAIEVLKKLIWKFPQKKAYFAAQIEDLKK